MTSVQPFNVAMVPKFDGLTIFDQARSGAIAAHRELASNTKSNFLLEYIAPPIAETSVQAQIDIVQSAAGLDFGYVLLSNNAADDIVSAALAAQEANTHVITWDSPIPSGVDGGETLFISQVDFDKTGMVMADMALQLFPNGGQYAILSGSSKAANINTWVEKMKEVMTSDPNKYGALELVTTLYTDDTDQQSYKMALDILEAYPNLNLIMSPTVVGIAAASRAVNDKGRCDTIKVSGLGLPSEMLSYTLNGCAPLFALWSFYDLGYLSYYATHALHRGAFTVEAGATFSAGRLGSFTVERDPTRDTVEAYRVVMGDFTLYDKINVEEAAFIDIIQGDVNQQPFEERYIEKFKKKAIAIIPKVTGMISFLASLYIIINVLKDSDRRSHTKDRLLVGISVHDTFSSFFGFFLSTWPMPEKTWLVPFAVGTVQTCSMQGFFFQAGILASSLYHASLSSYFVMKVVSGTNDAFIKRRYEPVMHAFPILLGWGTAIAGLPLRLYNAADRVGFMCYIAEYPPYCSLRDSCTRGQNAQAYRWAFLLSWIFAVFLFMTASMGLIYYNVRANERKSRAWAERSRSQRTTDQPRRVAVQGFRYVVAFIFPWLFGIAVLLLQSQVYGDLSASVKTSSSITTLEIINAVIWPLKGFFTMLAYARPYQRQRNSSQQTIRPVRTNYCKTANASAKISLGSKEDNFVEEPATLGGTNETESTQIVNKDMSPAAYGNQWSNNKNGNPTSNGRSGRNDIQLS